MISAISSATAKPQALRFLLAESEVMSEVPDIEVRGLQLDSRKVEAGDLFIALHGHQSHGLQHASQSIDNGCAGVVYDPVGAEGLLNGLEWRVPFVAVNNLSQRLGALADRFFGHPSASMDVIGITGTNGKTSCSHFLAEVLGLGDKAGVVGTLGWGKPGHLKPTLHTTPDAIEVHRVLNALRSEGFRFVAMEASSHGLVQGRLNGVRFKGAVFTNFSRDHLDYHQTMEAYLEAKLLLLDSPGLEFVVLNAQDETAALIRHRAERLKCVGFCPMEHASELGIPLLRFGGIQQTACGVAFTIEYERQSATIKAPVFGDFNVENLTATMAVLLCLGWPFSNAANALAEVRPVPGRMENVRMGEHGAVIDFAHTPDALVSVLQSIREHCVGKLWVVFGCGGDRDRGKRPQMGAVADTLADRLVITDDNPRSEDPEGIIRDILDGVSRQDFAVIRDRREAIRFALENCGADDLVLVAGKGHETSQEISGVKYPFSDREVVAEILNQWLPGSAES